MAAKGFFWLRLAGAFFALTFAVINFSCVASAYEEDNGVPLYEEYLFSVLYPPDWTIVPILPAYEKDGVFYLPILELAEGFEFYAGEQEIGRLYVAGFAVSEENSFALDGVNKHITVKGRRIDIDGDSIIPPEETGTDDIYVQLEVINQLWPVNMQVDLSTLTITASSEIELSFVRRKDREERRDIALSRAEEEAKKEDARAKLTAVDNPYRFFSMPVIDIQTLLTHDMDLDQTTGQANISASHQLGKMVADYAGNLRLDEYGNIREPRNLRFRLSRTGTGTEDVFVKGVKRLDLGDVNVRQRELVGNSISGLGAIVSNMAQRDGQEFDVITVEGKGPIGWEIEVYNNTELVETGEVDEEGEYRFDDVTLNYGNNEIRVVLYGPQGQIREDTKDYNISGNMLEPGKFQYYMGFADRDEPLFPMNIERENTDEGVAGVLSTRFGVNEHISLFANYNRQPARGDVTQYLSGGAAFSTPVGLGEVEAYKQAGRGTAVDASFITRIMGLRLNISNAFFNNFESDDAGYGADAKNIETEIDAKRNFRLPFASLGLSLNYNRTERESGGVISQYRFSQSLGKAGFRLNNTTTHRYQNGDQTGATGRIDANYRDGNWQYRGNASYSIYPEKDLNSAQFELRYKEDDLQAAINSQYNFQEDIMSAGAQIGYDFGSVLGSFDVSHQDHRGWQFMLRTTTSLYPYNKDEEYMFSSSTQRRATPVKGVVYLDNNYNSRYDEGEDFPLPDVYLERDGARSRDKTDEDGEVVVYGASNRETGFTVNARSLDNPYFVPGVDGYKIVPRIASMPVLEFPVIETGAVEGAVYDDETGREIAGLRLQLVDADGKIVGETDTGMDGYYIFEFVPPGDYTIQPDPVYARTNIPPVSVSVTPEELFVLEANLLKIADPMAGRQGREEGGDEAEAVSEPESFVHKGHAKKVKIGRHPDRVERFVIELAGDAGREVRYDVQGTSIVVELPLMGWRALRSWKANNPYVIESYSAEDMGNNAGTRLTIRGSGNIDIKGRSFLEPNSTDGARLYFDVMQSN